MIAAGIALWFTMCLIEGFRQGGLQDGPRIAVALGTVHVGLTLGFWRGLLDFRSVRHPSLIEWKGEHAAS